MRNLPLTKGYVTVVDDDDYDKIANYVWPLKYRHQPDPLKWQVSDAGKPRPYAVKRRGPTTLRLHRFIFELNGMKIPEGYEVDHINHNTLDNRKSNLRLVTRGENNANMRKRKDNTTGYKGVFYLTGKRKKRYWAFINKDGRRYGLGTYATAVEAARAYNQKSIELFGDNAYLNRV